MGTFTISIHAPRVGRDVVLFPSCLLAIVISIHAPRVGRDGHDNTQSIIRFLFQSTRPVWGATLKEYYDFVLRYISIHAPRVGRDTHGARKQSA